MTYRKLVIKLLIHCLYILMELRESSTGSVYSWESERKTIKESQDFIRMFIKTDKKVGS